MSKQDLDWWAGVAEMAASGLTHGALKLERVHLSIADETFNILQQVPVTRPFGEAARLVHHNIARVSYRGVSAVSAGLGMLARVRLPPGNYCTFSMSPNRSVNRADER